MTAVQAQDFLGAKWSIGLRMPESTTAEIEAAIADGSVVRSWPMRGTLHFVAAEDLGWMLSLSKDRMVKRARTNFENEGLTPTILESAEAAARAALAGGKALDRDQLYALLEVVGVSDTGQSRYHAVWYLCQTGALCLGPPRGKKQTFVLLDEWVPEPRRLERDEAIAELALRYFGSHGPATLKDFSWWSSLTVADARIGLAIARPQLESLDVDGVEFFMSPGLPDAPVPSGVQLLPGFDEYLLGYADRSVALTEEYSPLVFPGKNGMFLPTIVVDGDVVGTWKRTMKSKYLEFEPSPFVPLGSRVSSAVSQAAQGYARFLGLPLRADA